MADLNQKSKKETNSSGSGALTQPDDDLQSVYNYREILDQFWTLFTDVDLGMLKSDGKEIKTTESQLRDIIQNLRAFRDTPAGKELAVDKVLDALWDALKDLYRARDLINGEDNPQVINPVTYDNKDKYDKFQSFLSSIESALGSLPSRPAISETAPPMKIVPEAETELPETG
jgi:hypothetical protein